MDHRTRLVSRHEGYLVWNIGMDRALELTDFVFHVYYRKFAEKYGWQGEDYDKMHADDLDTLERSTIYAATDERGNYLATMRLIERNGQQLPIERDFGIDTQQLCWEQKLPTSRIYEVARLAKSAQAIEKAGFPAHWALSIVDRVIAAGVQEMVREDESVWFAGIDEQVLKLLRMRGFPFEPVGDTVYYVGSPTSPVMLTSRECRAYMRAHIPEHHAFYFGDTGIEEAA